MEPLLSENVIEIVADYQREIRLCLAFQLIFKAFRPSHSKSTNKSIFQERSGVVMTSHSWAAVN